MFTDAYVLRPAAARWLLQRHAEVPTAMTEDLMCDLQKRGGVWQAHPKKLAVQTCEESYMGGAQAAAMAGVYAAYFGAVPRKLYDDGES
jgi:hypothetical protein